MLVRTGLLRKKADWDLARFRGHWLGHHASLARQLKALRGYVQNFVTGPFVSGELPRGALEFDGFSQLWFDDGAAMSAAISDEIGPKLIADERYFMGEVDIVIARQVEVVPAPKGKSGVKLWSLVTRGANVPAERFAREWSEVLAPQVAALPGILGYRQNLILDREVPKGTPVGYDRLPIDGISEIWLDDVDAIAAAAASPAGRKAVSTAKGLIGKATTYLVDVHVVV
jgi:uncharacterized protein (TIGR02118 family)